MGPLIFGALALGGLALLSRRNDDDYGAVSYWQGGRGVDVDSGVASQMGGRAPGLPYEYFSPSSTITNWEHWTVYGGDADLDGDDEDVFGITILGIPFGKKSRLQKLNKKIDKAKERIAEYEAEAETIEDDSQLARLATKIAKTEARMEKWEDKVEKIESKMGALEEEFAGRDPEVVERAVIQKVEWLSDQVLNSAKKLRRKPRGRKAYQNMLTMVAAFDELVTLVDAAIRPALRGGEPEPVEILSDEVSGYGGEPRPELSDALRAVAMKAQAAGQVYHGVRAADPHGVQAMEETLAEAGF